MNLFRETAAKCSLIDLNFVGNKFTWSNGRKDHAPILVCFDTEVAYVDKQGRRRKRFQFENMWLQHPQLESVVKNTWQERTWGCNFQEKVKICGQVLMEWDRHEFGHIRTKINKLKDKLDKAQQEIQSEDTLNTIRNLEDELNQCLKLEEILWSQRSHTLWLKECDKNSKFFHKKTTHCRKRYTIKKICNAEGLIVTNRKDIERVILDHFQTIFRSEGCHEIEVALDAINTNVTKHMSQSLSKPYTKEEITKALQQMHLSKAPGPDETLSTLLYQAEARNHIHGYQAARSAPPVSHLFCRAYEREALELKNILHIYEKAYGQKTQVIRGRKKFLRCWG
ncbi:hypothetical protein SASPL_143662 [Salvia splendens]|uniref:Uncharacterized protein n=1 Tax=Salvia splendens TaxID=180675 RepID=A0A8X8WP31_SALSN|nr:hypothetical protein SASPL_143662 [Salvia splendens]